MADRASFIACAWEAREGDQVDGRKVSTVSTTDGITTISFTTGKPTEVDSEDVVTVSRDRADIDGATD